MTADENLLLIAKQKARLKEFKLPASEVQQMQHDLKLKARK